MRYLFKGVDPKYKVLASHFHLRTHIPVVVSVEVVPQGGSGVAGAPPTVHVVPVEITVVTRVVPPGAVVRAGAVASPAIVVRVIGRELVAVVVAKRVASVPVVAPEISTVTVHHYKTGSGAL